MLLMRFCPDSDDVKGGVPSSERAWGEHSPEKNNVLFLGLKMHILVHSPAHLYVCFCIVIYVKGVQSSDLHYACPFPHFRLTVAQSKSVLNCPQNNKADYQK